MAKGVAGWPPRYLTKVPAADIRRGRGDDVVDFVEALCLVVKE